jgi:hypothetical protein
MLFPSRKTVCKVLHKLRPDGTENAPQPRPRTEGLSLHVVAPHKDAPAKGRIAGYDTSRPSDSRVPSDDSSEPCYTTTQDSSPFHRLLL